MKHTHGKVRVVPCKGANDTTNYDIEHDCEGMGVVTIATVDGEREGAHQDAEHLALCWNTHDELVKAAYAVLADLQDLNRTTLSNIDRLDAALAAAKKG